MWTELRDPDNPENKNAGNGGDLIKHTVYLTVLEHLLSHTPWREGLRVRECHAGRGVYSIPVGDRRRSLLKCLYDPLDTDTGVLLHDRQRESQRALGIWPAEFDGLGWYAGSAVMNAQRLAFARRRHLIEFYEKSPDTRRVLREVLGALGPDARGVEIRVLPDTENGRQFDGEQHIVNSINGWDSRDLVLLDPFAMWRRPRDQSRRNLYGRIVDVVTSKGQDSPVLVLFWTWGRAFPAAEGDLRDQNSRVCGGYQDLRERLIKAGRRIISVIWRWELQFAMWVLVRDSQQHDLASALEQLCRETHDHLSRSRRLADVEVTLEG